MPVPACVMNTSVFQVQIASWDEMSVILQNVILPDNIFKLVVSCQLFHGSVRKRRDGDYDNMYCYAMTKGTVLQPQVFCPHSYFSLTRCSLNGDWSKSERHIGHSKFVTTMLN
jgi:hypothetical protein